MDDVLVIITEKWILNACKHYKLKDTEVAKKILEHKDVLGDLLMKRPVYYIQNWLTEAFGLEASHYPYLDEVYRQDEDFYDSLQPTEITLK